MKTLIKTALIFSLLIFFNFGILFAGGFTYNIKVKGHGGSDLEPSQAYEMLKKDPQHTFIVDVRTRAEYQLIGHPVGASNIPLKYWNGLLGDKKYEMSPNPNFGKDLLARFNPATDKLLFMCRSGKRSCFACNEAIKAGWAEGNVFNILGGFQGDKIKNENSAFNNQRLLGGWRNEGLPWSYHIDKKLVYQADLTR